MSARRLRSGDEEEGVLLDRGVDREWTRRPSDVDGQIDETKSAGQSRLPASRRTLDRIPRRIVADEILLADERVDSRIESGRCGADLLSVALDRVIEGFGLEPQRDLGELLRLAHVGVAPEHHRHSADPEHDDEHSERCTRRRHEWLCAGRRGGTHTYRTI